jgi:pimeloyl-ACP methyl ester carboxylesterase
MAYTASGLLEAWNSQRKDMTQKGLICICFDQRNHGSRMIEADHNVSWKQGNATHGQDMFNSYTGTAQDLSLLMTQLPMYLPFKIDEHICGGVSLGGHASWVAVMNDPRIVGAIIVVGCPDYTTMMTDRAIRSKVHSTLTSDPPGRNFLGSSDFPQSLLAAVEKYDPAGMLYAELDVYDGKRDLISTPSAAEQKRLRPVLTKALAGKKILCLSGGKDRLVPYACGEGFLSWLKRAIDQPTGWAGDLKIRLHDFIDPAAGHEFSAPMRKVAQDWLCAFLDGDEVDSGKMQSKI